MLAELWNVRGRRTLEAFAWRRMAPETTSAVSNWLSTGSARSAMSRRTEAGGFNLSLERAGVKHLSFAKGPPCAVETF
jgi:hypothetical protein